VRETTTYVYMLTSTYLLFVMFLARLINMPSSIGCYEVIGPIGSGTFATCKKIRRKKDGKVLYIVNRHSLCCQAVQSALLAKAGLVTFLSSL